MESQAVDLQDARQGTVAVTVDRNRMATAYNEAGAQLGHLRGQWYVVWGIRIERSFWTISIGWIVLNIVAFIGGIF